MLTPWKESYDQPRQHIKKQRHYIANKGPSSQGYGLSSSHEWMWVLDYKESWALKNGCFWTVVLEKTLESPLDCKEIEPVHAKGDQFWIFIGRTDAEAETLTLWPPDAKNWLIWKDPDAGKEWGQEEKGMTEYEVVGCITDSMDMSLSKLLVTAGLACCSPWGCKKSDMIKGLNWTELTDLKETALGKAWTPQVLEVWHPGHEWVKFTCRHIFCFLPHVQRSLVTLRTTLHLHHQTLTLVNGPILGCLWGRRSGELKS